MSVVKRIKGGMIVNLLGSEAFLPGSQGDVRMGRGSGLGHSLRNASSVFGPVSEDELFGGRRQKEAGNGKRYPRPSGQWRQDAPVERLRRASKEDLQPTLPGSSSELGKGGG